MILDKITQIARVCHEANRAYCETLGDQSQQPWDLAPPWQQSSARQGVTEILAGVISTPEQSHESWLAEKVVNGWTYGETRDQQRKTHPCIMPYSELPVTQQIKDRLFFAITKSMLTDSSK